MKFQSTRDKNQTKYTASHIIKQGLADDGGLFVPDSLPELTKGDILALCKDPYPVRAAKILSMFLDDYTYGELFEDCSKVYAEPSFEGGIAPVKQAKDGIYSIELWHGPTAAFKDMALQIMPRLLSRALVKNKEDRTALILVATSGDTGKAALEGYRDVDHIKIMVFYPVDGVSKVQKLQMATQTGENVNVLAIRGNFDDAQTGVKKLFSDREVAEELNRRGYFLSSANSINWGRLAPQIVYYVSAYCDLVNDGKIGIGDRINVCVPTGNFGNIFAAYLARRIGLPLGKLICASNRNNILTDFLRTGTYDRNRAFHITMSPSMDILISSNLERLLYFTAGADRTREYMDSLAKSGQYTVDEDVKEQIDRDFVGYFATEEETAATVRDYFASGYLADPHTAVALCAAEKYRRETGDKTPVVVASTASPYKFAADVYRSLTGRDAPGALAALDLLAAHTGTEIPYPLRGIADRAVRFTEVSAPERMKEDVLGYAE